ncbi:MAG: hypothetical protein Q8Q09_02360 [Deltaproteobacteria bacterium]|nr:hypothetical protein [Deltaproteobacteria bacterium]
MNRDSLITSMPLHARDVDESLVIDPTRSGAYQWWYFDATSDDGEHSLVIIVFVGSVFSPWYFGRTLRGEGPLPREHCAVNIALSRKGHPLASRWVFSEYAGFEGSLRDGLVIGGNTLRKEPSGEYVLRLDDISPLFSLSSVVRGEVRFAPVGPSALVDGEPYTLDQEGRHRWLPVAPRCRVRAVFSAPSLVFEGEGYHDVNHGDEPLGAAFVRWHWARSHEPTQTRIRYDRALRGGERRVLDLALRGDQLQGSHRSEPRAMELKLGGWTLQEPKTLRVDAQTALMHVRRVESSPFYVRFAAQTPTGHPAVGEHLDLDRFALPSMQRMLPFRSRRVT